MSKNSIPIKFIGRFFVRFGSCNLSAALLFIWVCSQESAKETEANNMEAISTVVRECCEGYLMTFTILSAYKIS